ncbi:MAG: hypothetical protein LBR45_04525, partial [Bacteroidales bacterium]|nr:hypothetical protein [Bacteroidales bacterium]
IEKDILRLLINYGSKELEPQVRVADCVIRYFSENNISFSNPSNQIIFDFIKNAIQNSDNSHIPDINEMMSIDNEEAKNIIVTLASSQYSISKNWCKKGIYVQEEEEKLNDVWHSYMYEQLLAYINEQIEKNQHDIEKLEQTGDDDFLSLAELLSQRNNLNAVKKKLSVELNRIVR